MAPTGGGLPWLRWVTGGVDWWDKPGHDRKGSEAQLKE
jgi:hypothetical protein